MSFDDLGDRMKGYEDVPRIRLVPRMPVILRLDGKAFHTLTRGMQKPWDERFQRCMWDATRALCAEIQGVQVAYTQSDEISLFLIDYKALDSCAWFDYGLQKMVSVSASIATDAFKDSFRALFPDRVEKAKIRFDSRAFNLPREEVTNYFIWRQQDAVRNSISSAAQSVYSHGELHGKSQKEQQELLFQKGINWNDYPTAQRRGVCCVKSYSVRVVQNPTRPKWVVDMDIPVFTQDRTYIERFVAPEVTP